VVIGPATDLHFVKYLKANRRGLVGGLQRNFYLVEGLYLEISGAYQRSLYLWGDPMAEFSWVNSHVLDI
jgi:hypothetical protein